jgi:hypothetical protein
VQFSSIIIYFTYGLAFFSMGLLGGTVSIQSRPGNGTLVEALIPYHYRNEEQNDHTSVTGG